jgi:hypothetical protein
LLVFSLGGKPQRSRLPIATALAALTALLAGGTVPAWADSGAPAGVPAPGPVTAPEPAPPNPALPPDLVALEHKGLQLQVTSESVGASVTVNAPNAAPSGPFGGFNPSARAAAAFALLTLRGAIAFEPRAGSLELSILGIKVNERFIGTTVWAESPFIAKLDGGRPWVEEKDVPAQPLAGLEIGALGGSSGSGASQAFGGEIEEFNGARKIVEVGARRIDGQNVTVFRGELETAKLTAKDHDALGIERKLLKPLLPMELMFNETGTPVRTVFKLGIRHAHGAALIGQSDVLALNPPVSVQPPPADQVITETELKRIERSQLERLRRKLRRQRHHGQSGRH